MTPPTGFCRWSCLAAAMYLSVLCHLLPPYSRHEWRQWAPLWRDIRSDVLRPAALWLGLRQPTLNELLRSHGLPEIVVYETNPC